MCKQAIYISFFDKTGVYSMCLCYLVKLDVAVPSCL